jgi:hypothetical protein
VGKIVGSKPFTVFDDQIGRIDIQQSVSKPVFKRKTGGTLIPKAQIGRTLTYN